MVALVRGFSSLQPSSRMLKQSASSVLALFGPSTDQKDFRRSESLEGLFRSPRPILGANGPHEVWSVPPRPFTRCGLAWHKARPWTKRLSWQTQGGRVRCRRGQVGEKSGPLEHPSGNVPIALDIMCPSRSNSPEQFFVSASRSGQPGPLGEGGSLPDSLSLCIHDIPNEGVLDEKAASC